MTCLGSWGCGARRATGLGVAESVRSGPTVLLAKQTGFGRTEMIKGWASVIIPTSLAGVEIAGSVKFINSCSLSVPWGGGDAVWAREIVRVQFVGKMGLTRFPECGATRGAGGSGLFTSLPAAGLTCQRFLLSSRSLMGISSKTPF